MIHHYTLKDFQSQALSILNQEKTAHIVCMAPTGSGKSYIFQKYLKDSQHIKALLISPLNALSQQHQRDFTKFQIKSVHLSPSAQSHLYTPEESQVWILSPEKIFNHNNSFFLKKIREFQPQLLIVDECHCVFEWGTHFRPSFLEILSLIKTLSLHKSLWLTATLEMPHRTILKNLFKSDFFQVGGFELPENLMLSQLKIPYPLRLAFLRDYIKKKPTHSTGLVFTSSRKTAEKLTRFLNAHTIPTYYFHAGLSLEEKETFTHLLSNKKINTLVSTTAFGMGMNYPYFEWCVLFQPLYSISQMAQAFGRIGRNKSILKAQGLALWDENDFYNFFHALPKKGTLNHDISTSQQQTLNLYEFLSSPQPLSNKFIQYFHN